MMEEAGQVGAGGILTQSPDIWQGRFQRSVRTVRQDFPVGSAGTRQRPVFVRAVLLNRGECCVNAKTLGCRRSHVRQNVGGDPATSPRSGERGDDWMRSPLNAADGLIGTADSPTGPAGSR